METNSLTIAIVLLAAIVVVFFLMRRNMKDEKEFEKDASQSELDPQKHKKDEI